VAQFSRTYAYTKSKTTAIQSSPASKPHLLRVTLAAAAVAAAALSSAAVAAAVLACPHRRCLHRPLHHCLLLLLLLLGCHERQALHWC